METVTLSYEPFLDNNPLPATDAQRIALAKMFSNVDLRSCITHLIEVYNKEALQALRYKKLDIAEKASHRAEALENLLNTSKVLYMHYDKIDASKK